jgi:uncharacterized repeat protein (TIGR01451 family)
MFTTRSLKGAFAIAVAVALYLPLQADVKVLLVASKIVKLNGNEQKQPGDKAKPGDVIEYVAEYKNLDKKAVLNVVATLPVPSGMEYLPQTATPERAMASTDDVNYSSIPLRKNVRGADGKTVQQMVPYTEYRSLRWELGEIGGGASKSVKARMKVKATQ